MSLAIIMPCWLRPQRTARAIRSVLDQTCPDWRLYVIGDACPVLPGVMAGFDDPRIVYENLPTHEGRYGTQCLNRGLELAREPWACFLGNDDYLSPLHVATRLGAAHSDGGHFTGYHFDAAIKWPHGMAVRPSGMSHGSTGGSELMVPTDLARRVGFRSGDYGHDWTFIEGLNAEGIVWKHVPAAPTYIVTHLPGNLRETDID